MDLFLKEQNNILVVGDVKCIVEFIRMGLEAEGFTVNTAYDGDEAISLAKKVNPRIIILDIMLLGTNGNEVYTKLKKLVNTTFIMLSGKDEQKGDLNAGTEDYLSNPFTFNELLAHINSCLKNEAGGRHQTA